jgi:hypothetical protein
MDSWGQGDQIGHIFAFWATVYFGQLFKITKVVQFWGGATFSAKMLCINYDKNGLGYILGNFFHSSGHPGRGHIWIMDWKLESLITWKL